MINYTLIFFATLVAIASPGPATLAVAGASMERGRTNGMVLACGVLTGSLFWSTTSVLGLSSLMLAYPGLIDVIRYFGAIYLLYLAAKNAKSAMSNKAIAAGVVNEKSLRSAYLHGLAIHLTNPKPILFFAALFSITIPTSAALSDLLLIIGLLAILAAIVFFGYAMLFSIPAVRKKYLQSKRFFEVIFAGFFAFAGIRVLLAR